MEMQNLSDGWLPVEMALCQAHADPSHSNSELQAHSLPLFVEWTSPLKLSAFQELELATPPPHELRKPILDPDPGHFLIFPGRSGGTEPHRAGFAEVFRFLERHCQWFEGGS